MGKIIEKFRSWFPSLQAHRHAAEKQFEEVKKLKTLTVNGDQAWFIDQCKKFKEEVCDDNKL